MSAHSVLSVLPPPAFPGSGDDAAPETAASDGLFAALIAEVAAASDTKAIPAPPADRCEIRAPFGTEFNGSQPGEAAPSAVVAHPTPATAPRPAAAPEEASIGSDVRSAAGPAAWLSSPPTQDGGPTALAASARPASADLDVAESPVSQSPKIAAVLGPSASTAALPAASASPDAAPKGLAQAPTAAAGLVSDASLIASLIAGPDAQTVEDDAGDISQASRAADTSPPSAESSPSAPVSASSVSASSVPASPVSAGAVAVPPAVAKAGAGPADAPDAPDAPFDGAETPTADAASADRPALTSRDPAWAAALAGAETRPADQPRLKAAARAAAAPDPADVDRARSTGAAQSATPQAHSPRAGQPMASATPAAGAGAPEGPAPAASPAALSTALASSGEPFSGPEAASPAGAGDSRLSLLSRATVDAMAQIAARILKTFEGRSTRFDMALTPESLGRVDVRLEMAGDGRLTARLAFDNAAAVADLRGRAEELRRQLEDAGFQLDEDSLEFAERDPASSFGGGFERPSRRRAFAGAARLAAEADALSPPSGAWTSLSLTPERVDLKV